MFLIIRKSISFSLSLTAIQEVGVLPTQWSYIIHELEKDRGENGTSISGFPKHAVVRVILLSLVSMHTHTHRQNKQ